MKNGRSDDYHAFRQNNMFTGIIFYNFFLLHLILFPIFVYDCEFDDRVYIALEVRSSRLYIYLFIWLVLSYWSWIDGFRKTQTPALKHVYNCMHIAHTKTKKNHDSHSLSTPSPPNYNYCTYYIDIVYVLTFRVSTYHPWKKVRICNLYFEFGQDNVDEI